jgi:two-component system alkaline phosphatase synthesis response regulator PhoP
MFTKRILIIDDEETIQTVVQFGIKITASWEVFAAGSGEQGIRIAQIESPDAILLDIMMPDMNGITTLKILQSYAETREIPVIFLTAREQPLEKCQVSDLGVKGVITKPFNSLELPGQIARILAW